MRMACTEDGKKQDGQARDGDRPDQLRERVLGGWSGLNCCCQKDISRSSGTNECDLIWKRGLCRGVGPKSNKRPYQRQKGKHRGDSHVKLEAEARVM